MIVLLKCESCASVAYCIDTIEKLSVRSVYDGIYLQEKVQDVREVAQPIISMHPF